MNINDIKQLITKGESELLEFKKSTAELHSVMRTVCAFLNSKSGGIVLIGVTDGKKIIGQHVTDKTKKDIATEINKIEPYSDVEISYINVDQNRQLVALQVKAGHKVPYVYDGKPFMRNQSST